MSGLEKLIETMDEMDLVTAVWSRRVLTLTFDVKPAGRWEIRCSGVLESHITDARHCGLNVWHGDHAAVDQYLQPHVRLRIGAVPIDVDRLIGGLWRAHHRVAGDWIEFERYFDPEHPLELLSLSGPGMLAEGPEFLMDAYVPVLESNECRPRRNTRGTEPLAANATMIHFGDSFVVAEAVSAKALKEP